MLQALGFAFVKAVVAIVGITAGGRMFIRPLYKKISNLANAEIFAATTLLVVLGTSFMTQLAGRYSQAAGGCTQQPRTASRAQRSRRRITPGQMLVCSWHPPC